MFSEKPPIERRGTVQRPLQMSTIHPEMFATSDRVSRILRNRSPESGPLQSLFHPAVADRNPVLVPQLFVKVQHAQIEVSLLMQRQHLLRRFHRYPVDAPF